MWFIVVPRFGVLVPSAFPTPQLQHTSDVEHTLIILHFREVVLRVLWMCWRHYGSHPHLTYIKF